MKRVFQTLIFMLILVPAGFGIDDPFYVGAGLGRSYIDAGVDATTGSIKLDEEDTGFKVFAGFELNDILSIEAQYVDFGEMSIKGNNRDTFMIDGDLFQFTSNNSKFIADLNTIGLSAIIKAPSDSFIKPYGKLGFHYWNADIKLSSPTINLTADESGTGIMFGGGIEAHIHKNWAIRVELERYNLDGDDTDFISINALFSQ